MTDSFVGTVWHKQAAHIQTLEVRNEQLEAALRQRDEETKRFESGVNWPMEAHRANARIEALEAALREIAELTTDDDFWEIHRITRAALAPEQEK